MPYTNLIVAGLLIAASSIAWLTARLIRLRKPGRGSLAYWIFAVLGIIWALSYAGEVVSVHEHDKLLWIRISYLARPYIAVAWMLFILRITHHDRLVSPLLISLLLIIPASATILAWSNPWHNLMWSDLAFSYGGLLPRFTPAPTPFYFLYIRHTDLILAASIALMLWHIYHTRTRYWAQTLLSLVVVCIPWLNAFLYFIGLEPLPGINLGSFTFVLMVPLGAWLFFRYRPLELMPSARALILHSMPDGVLIISLDGHVLSTNTAGVRIFRRSERDLRDQAIRDLLPQLVHDSDGDNTSDNASIPLHFRQQINGRWYDLRFQPLTKADACLKIS